MQADAAAGSDEDIAVVQRVCEVGQAGVGSRTRRVDFGRTLHGERLVWSFGVEFLDKVVEAGLLLQAVRSGRSGCFFLQLRCMRSWRPFCCGWPGLMRSMAMPRRSHQTERRGGLLRALGVGEGSPVLA